MKHIISFCIALICSAPAFSQNEKTIAWKDLVGTWNGYYSVDGTQKTITFVFTESRCTVDMPDEGLKSAAFDVRLCQAGDIHITQQGIGKGFSFAGTPAGDAIQGKYKIGDVCRPNPPDFKVERVTTATK